MITSFFLLRPSRLLSGAGRTQELAKLGPFNSRVQETLRHRLFVILWSHVGRVRVGDRWAEMFRCRRRRSTIGQIGSTLINWNRRRSRILKAMKANTKGMLAIHPTRRNLTGLTRCNPNTITEPLYPTTHAVWPSYSD